jgi:hypothetical protein
VDGALQATAEVTPAITWDMGLQHQRWCFEKLQIQRKFWLLPNIVFSLNAFRPEPTRG